MKEFELYIDYILKNISSNESLWYEWSMLECMDIIVSTNSEHQVLMYVFMDCIVIQYKDTKRVLLPQYFEILYCGDDLSTYSLM